MTATSNTKSLELTVTNFGPIAEAKVELRPLTVFVGPSNTGKSYMAGLIYAMQRFFTNLSDEPEFGSIHGRPTWLDRIQMDLPKDHVTSENDIEKLFSRVEEMLRQLKTAKPRSTSTIEVPDSVAAMVRSILDGVAHLSDDLDGEIARCFGVSKTSKLVHFPNKIDTSVFLLAKAPAETGAMNEFSCHFTFTEQVGKLSASIPEAMPLRIDQNAFYIHLHRHLMTYHPRVKDAEERERFANDMINSLAINSIQQVVDPLSHPAFYLPADRAGVMHAHQVFVRTLIAGATRTALRPNLPMPAISGVLGDFLEQLVALASVSRQKSDIFDELALHLEQTILRGTIRVERSEIDYPSISYRPIGWERDLPLMNSSSMISELTPVVLYLRYVVQPGDLLIIEEPEAHLHPEMQAAFTRLLASAVQSGIRILITTHSEWILEELANLVRLSELPKERRVGLENADIALSPDQLGAWFFEPNEEEGGSVVREISLDEESATFPAGFGLVTESLYNRWAEISSRIQEG